MLLKYSLYKQLGLIQFNKYNKYSIDLLYRPYNFETEKTSSMQNFELCHLRDRETKLFI